MGTSDQIIMACCSDIAGQVRGKGFPESDLPTRLKRGIGWTPTNVMINCFDVIADSPFGALGDLALIPDPNAGYIIRDAGGEPVEQVMLGDIVTLEGDPWNCCTRSILKQALRRLDEVAGLNVTAAFEHEFQLLDSAEGASGDSGTAYSLGGARSGATMGRRIFQLMARNNLRPDTFMKEFGADQFEVTMKPSDGLGAADQATMLREMVRVAAAEGRRRATFTPIRTPAGVGNGVHVHVSLNDRDGKPVTYDPDTETGLSEAAASFAAGLTTFLPSILALLAPSAISYLRLTPHRWSAAYNNLGLRDREASVRICPVTALDPLAIARQFNLEIRACDAAASPYLQLAAIIHAGTEGIARELAAPKVTEADLSVLSAEELAAMGIARLPTSLDEALKLMAGEAAITSWFGEEVVAVYQAHKRGELAVLDGLSPEDQCARYLEVY
ncbi:MAG: glutamine synthetase family protein [Minwuia sp.]|nr:glutamine synthetase family protein [Minwuia sp.]